MFEGKPALRALQTTSPLRLVRNPLWRGSTKIDEVQFIVCLADPDGSPRELIEAFRRGEIDLTAALTAADLARSSLASAVPALQPGNSTGILFFNTTHRILSRADVRKAIALAIDVYDIAQRSYDRNPLAFIARSLLPPMMGRPTGLPSMNREEAKRLLAAAGADRPTRLSLLVPWAPRQYLPKPVAAAEAISAHLAEVGITVELRETATPGVYESVDSSPTTPIRPISSRRCSGRRWPKATTRPIPAAGRIRPPTRHWPPSGSRRARRIGRSWSASSPSRRRCCRSFTASRWSRIRGRCVG